MIFVTNYILIFLLLFSDVKKIVWENDQKRCTKWNGRCQIGKRNTKQDVLLLWLCSLNSCSKSGWKVHHNFPTVTDTMWSSARNNPFNFPKTLQSQLQQMCRVSPSRYSSCQINAQSNMIQNYILHRNNFETTKVLWNEHRRVPTNNSKLTNYQCSKCVAQNALIL